MVNRQLIVRYALCLSWLGAMTASVALGGASDIILRPNSRGGSVIYEEDGAVYYRQCFPEDETSRQCPSSMESPRLPRQQFIDALAAGYQLDPGVVTLGSTARLEREIRETEAAIASGTLNPEETIRAEEYLRKLKANEQRARRMFRVVDFLRTGTDLVLNENFNEDFALVMRPFDPYLRPNVPNAVSDRVHGVFWIEMATKICWYDAMDVSRNASCGAVLPGCAERFGRVWRLPKMREFASAVTQRTLVTCGPANESEACSYWTWDGLLGRPTSRYENGSYRYYVGQVSGAPRTNVYRAVCMAKARDLDPYGDIDEDGIENYRDRCNRLRDNPFDPIILNDPARLGCTSYQTPDAD